METAIRGRIGFMASFLREPVVPFWRAPFIRSSAVLGVQKGSLIF